MSVRPSVHPSVTLVLYQNEHVFVTIGEPEHSSFWKYLVHPEIRKGSPQARTIYGTGGYDLAIF